MRRLILILFLAIAFSCATEKKKPTQGILEEKKEETKTYYDFTDIPIPKDMKLITEKSFLVEYANLKGGVMHFEGRVDPLSLFNFFYIGMQKEGWNPVGYFKYGPYIILMEKPEKECVIRIEDGGWNTKLEIWITPKGIIQE